MLGYSITTKDKDKDKDKDRKNKINDKEKNKTKDKGKDNKNDKQGSADKQGMSRAAKKRRKKQGKGDAVIEKKHKVSNDFRNDNTYDNTYDNDDNDDNDNDDDDDNDNESNTQLVKSKKLHSDPYKFDDTIDVEITTSSILELLELEDVKDIDSYTRSATALSMVIYPSSRSTFYKDYWDQELLICTKSNKASNKSSSSLPAKNINFFNGLITKAAVLDIIKSHVIYNGIDIKVWKFEGKAIEPAYVEYNDDDENKIEVKYKDVHNKYLMGHTLKLLCPQKFHDPLWHFLSLLESEFNTSLSSSVTLIPPGCKSYPARYDFRHNFILQIEGSSHWMIYQPLETEEGQFEDHIIDDTLLDQLSGKEITLYPGDSLYIPKCWIYKEQSCTGTHSLHVNIFNNHPNNYGSLLDLLVPEALELLKVKSRKMKQTLPISISNLMGVAASENEDPKRGKFINAVKSLLNEVVKEATDMLDAGSDQMLKSFISNRLPIPMSSSEEERSAQGAPNARIYQYTKLRIVRPGVARAIIEDGKVIVYHCIYNDREHFKTVLSPLEYELDDGPAIEALLFSYPDGIIVEDLPHPSEEVDDKVSIAQSLYKEGLLIIEDETSVPSKINKDNESDEDDPF